MTQTAVDAEKFRNFERSRHNEIANSYNDFFVPITGHAIGPLLDSVMAASGTKLLDVATGPGIVAARAAEIGATVTGVDLSPQMIALACQLYPRLVFREADVEQLPFTDGQFDAVVSNFGIGHFPGPELAIAECVRVLSDGGRLAFSSWDDPSRARIAGVLIDAMRLAGATQPPEVPLGPQIYRFPSDDQFSALLRSAGLVNVAVRGYSFIHHVDSTDDWWRGDLGSLARISAMVIAQTVDMQQSIRSAFDKLAAAYAEPGGFGVPMAFKIASGYKVSR